MGHVRVKGHKPQGNLLMLVSVFGCFMIMADQLENCMIFFCFCYSPLFSYVAGSAVLFC